MAFITYTYVPLARMLGGDTPLHSHVGSSVASNGVTAPFASTLGPARASSLLEILLMVFLGRIEGGRSLNFYRAIGDTAARLLSNFLLFLRVIVDTWPVLSAYIVALLQSGSGVDTVKQALNELLVPYLLRVVSHLHGLCVPSPPSAHLLICRVFFAASGIPYRSSYYPFLSLVVQLHTPKASTSKCGQRVLVVLGRPFRRLL